MALNTWVDGIPDILLPVLVDHVAGDLGEIHLFGQEVHRESFLPGHSQHRFESVGDPLILLLNTVEQRQCFIHRLNFL